MGRAQLRGLMLCAALVAAPITTASAQPKAPPAEVQKLFEGAVEKMKANDFASACPQLEKVVELVPDGAGAKIALGDCYVGLGRLASALRIFVEAETAAAAASQKPRQEQARAKIDAIGADVPRVTITLGAELRGAPGLSVQVDGVGIAAQYLDDPHPVDAGDHIVRVAADGRVTKETRITIANREKKTVSVDRLETPAPTEGPAPTSPGPSFWTTPRFIAVALAGVGVAAVGAGAGVGVVATQRLDESNEVEGCNDETDTCPTQRGVDLRDEAVAFSHGSTAAFVIGGAFIATGVIVFILGGPDDDVEVRASTSFLELRGRF